MCGTKRKVSSLEKSSAVGTFMLRPCWDGAFVLIGFSSTELGLEAIWKENVRHTNEFPSREESVWEALAWRWHGPLGTENNRGEAEVALGTGGGVSKSSSGPPGHLWVPHFSLLMSQLKEWKLGFPNMCLPALNYLLFPLWFLLQPEPLPLWASTYLNAGKKTARCTLRYERCLNSELPLKYTVAKKRQ